MTTPQVINATVHNTVPAKNSTGKKDCTFCKPEGFKFLPLRYAVVSGVDEKQAAQWPELKHPLGEQVADLKIATSRYTVRLLRQGFVYVLVQRQKSPEWQAYAVTATGLLSSFPVGNPPATMPVFTCDLSTDGVGASFVAIEKIDEVKSIHLLFSPDVLSLEILAQRAKDKLGMQQMPPKNWQGHSHVLEATDLDKWVAEFKLNTDGMNSVPANDPKLTGRLPFARQLYPLMGGPGVNVAKYDDHLKRLTALKNQLQQMKSPAFVLWDPVGITQELNQWHRHVADEIEAQLKGKAEWQIATSQRILGLKYAVEQGAVEAAVYEDPDFAMGATGAEVRTDPLANSQVKAQAWGRYQLCYDEQLRAKTVAELETSVNSKLALAEQRFADLDRWLLSQELQTAFENYDTSSVMCGLQFHAQASLCTYALATSNAGLKRLAAWRADEELKQSNLMARQLLFNQKVAIDEFKGVLKKVQGKPDIDLVQLQSWLSASSGVFDKANDLASLANEGRLVTGNAGCLGNLLTAPLLVSTTGTTIFKMGGAADKVYAFALYLRAVPKAMMQAGADVLMQIFNGSYPSRSSTTILQAQQSAALRSQLRAKLQTLIKDKGSDFAGLHLGAAIALIEAFNLILKQRSYDPREGKHTSNDTGDLVAAYCATAAASGLIVANIAKINRGEASLWFNGLKLSNGVLGSVVAGVAAWDSFADAVQAGKDGRYLLLTLCSAKTALNGLVAVGSAAIGALYCAPLLEAASKKAGSYPGLSKALFNASHKVADVADKEIGKDILEKIGIRVADKVGVRVIGEALLAGIGWIMIAEQICEFAVGRFTDNKVQVWLTRCIYHKPPQEYGKLLDFIHDKTAGTSYDSLDKELDALDTALKDGV